MKKVMLANNLTSYMAGKSDGITFSNVSDSDLKTIESLAETYNKQIKIIEVSDPKSFVGKSDEIVTEKKKIKKIFITNGKETIKIVPDKLQEYMALGYRTGRK